MTDPAGHATPVKTLDVTVPPRLTEPKRYLLANTLSPRTSFDDAYFGVADHQMQQAATQSLPPTVRMSGTGSFCCDGKDSDFGLADEQLEAKNRAAMQAKSPSDGDTTSAFRYQVLPGDAPTKASTVLPPLVESRHTDEHNDEIFSPGAQSTASSAYSVTATPDDARFTYYQPPASNGTPFSEPFVAGTSPRQRRVGLRGLQCFDRVKQCFMSMTRGSE